MKKWILVVLAALMPVILVSACGNSTGQWVGTVTMVSPRLCVGRQAAAGNCFTEATPGMLTSVHPGDCVQVTFMPAGAGQPDQLIAIQPADPSQHRIDCPAMN